jgi:glycosyltransferase involved in cell wall biosynthesis
MNISVIIPLYNEAESLPELYNWIVKVMNTNHYTYEIIFINDGSTDNSWKVIQNLSKKSNSVRGIRFRRNYGKSPALYCGFKVAQGDVVITMDADLQDSPEEIPGLYKMIMEEDYDLVSGYKKKRYDPLSKTIPTRLFNATARWISGIHNLHDFNCGLKAYKKVVVKNIEVYGEMHRYIPYLAKNAGFDKIGEKVVHHQARKYGRSKFGVSRFFNGYLDLLTLWFLTNFGKKPMHVFGFLGSLVFFVGFIALIILGTDKLIALHEGIYGNLITDSPYFFIALTTMVLGTQLFLAGFIGDLISRQNVRRNDYQIAEEVHLNDKP